MRFFFWSCSLFILAWCMGLAVFAHALPKEPTPAATHTDAMVVLTGGSARVERGFSLLAEGAAPVLLISGVGKDVTLQEMLYAHASAPVRETIVSSGADVVLDKVADTTETNAREAAEFVRSRNYTSIRLITADYHMPRALVEFRAALPGVTVVPDAVFPATLKREDWWRYKNTRDLIFSEYHKTIAVYLRRAFPWLKQA